MSVHVAPAGTAFPPETIDGPDHPWTHVGHTTGPVTFADDAAVYTVPQLTEISRSIQTSVVSPAALEALFGGPPIVGPPEWSLSVTYLSSGAPDAPAKWDYRRARDNRAARRRYGRALRAWRRAGSPNHTHKLFVPRVTMRSVDHGGRVKTFGYSMCVSEDAWTDQPVREAVQRMMLNAAVKEACK